MGENEDSGFGISNKWRNWAAVIGVIIAAIATAGTFAQTWAVLPERMARAEMDISALKDALAKDHDLLVEIRTILREQERRHLETP